MGERIDDICVVRSLHTNRPNHEPSLFRLNCGNPLPGHSSMGSWLTYGLGTENQNLPGYVVLSPGYPVVGPQLWSSNFLPAVHQGTHIPNNETDPEKLIQHIRTKINAQDQRKQWTLASSAASHQRRRAELEATTVHGDRLSHAKLRRSKRSYPQETEQTRARYGDNQFARLPVGPSPGGARSRMVQVFFGEGQPWDNHDDIRFTKAGREPSGVRAPDAQKTTGLLRETVVMIGGRGAHPPWKFQATEVRTGATWQSASACCWRR